MEDIVEQIVGDIADEHDEDALPAMVRQPDGSFLADARASLEDVIAAIGAEFDVGDEAEEVDTLGGLSDDARRAGAGARRVGARARPASRSRCSMPIRAGSRRCASIAARIARSSATATAAAATARRAASPTHRAVAAGDDASPATATPIKPSTPVTRRRKSAPTATPITRLAHAIMLPGAGGAR